MSDDQSDETTFFNVSPQSTPSNSRRIGPYKLLQQIGEGGMGSVWMADQEEPVRRRVAIKLIKAGLDSKQVVARFEAERQALAMMDHQNIAKVLDAGTTEEGAPYFVMELVQGISFTKYCDQNKLSIEERLNLFVPVCKAIQHAHQKGIIHRDLKPSNVLVSLYDGKPVPKVIDFGLAKALQHQSKLTDKTMFTEFGQVVGTLQYMSPEQAEMNQLDVDTRTDIYSLGVMLYELLIGSTPIDEETLKQNAILQVLATIREQDPPRPSARLSSSTNDAVSGISTQRKIEPAKLKSILRGELDWIVMKALEKDRTRRYETASNFAEDVSNYLTGDIVAARPPSTAYRISKYIRRNKGLVTSLASIAVLLLAGIIGTSVFAVKANNARKDADAKTAEVKKEKSKAERERDRANENERVAKSETERASSEAKKATEQEELAHTARENAEATLARSNYLLAIARWNQGRIADAQILLSQVSEKYRNIEWYLDQRAFQGSDMTLYGHSGAVRSARFNPEGTRIVSGSDDCTVKLWDATSGRELRTFRGHLRGVNSVCFSPDGTQIVSGSKDGTVKQWDAIVGRELCTLKHKNHQASRDVTNVSFSPDGKRIASASGDGTVKLWDLATGQELHTLNGGGFGGAKAVSFSPDGTWIVSGGTNGVKLWDVDSGQQIRELDGAGGLITSVCFSPDGTQVAASSHATRINVLLWDATTGRKIRALQPHLPSSELPNNRNLKKQIDDAVRHQVWSVSFSPDGKRIATARNRMVKLWDAATGQESRALNGHVGEVTCASFSPDSTRLISGSDDNTVKIWDVTENQCSFSLRHRQWVTDVRFSPDGKRVASAGEGRATTGSMVKVWDAISGTELVSFAGDSFVSFSPDGELVVSGHDSSLQVCDAITGQQLWKFREAHLGSNAKVACFSHDGTKIVSGSGKALKMWDVATGKELAEAIPGVTPVCFSPDRKQLLVSRNEIWDLTDVAKRGLWDVVNGQETRSIEAHLRGVGCVGFSFDGTRLATSSSSKRDNTIRLWDVTTCEPIRTLRGHANSVSRVSSLCFSPDGTRIISGGADSTIKIWDSATGQELRSLRGHVKGVTSLDFSADGKRIASGSLDGTVKIWVAATGEEIRRLQGHMDMVKSASFGRRDKRIVSCSKDKSIAVWDVSTQRKLRTIRGPSDAPQSGNFGAPERTPNCATFSPDGTRIVSADGSKVRVWDVNTGEKLRTLFSSPLNVSELFFRRNGQLIIVGDKRLVLATMAGRSIDSYTVDYSLRVPDSPASLFAVGNRAGDLRLEKFLGNETLVDPSRSDDGRWFVVGMKSDVALIDLEYKNTPIEEAMCRRSASLKPNWHKEQAVLSEESKDWFAATFHRAWIMKAQPEKRDAWDSLHKAQKKLLKSREGEPLPLPRIVQQMLELPRGKE